MDKKEITRAKMVVAMEFIARQINNEDIFDLWLRDGVADGDIAEGSFDIAQVDDYYIEKGNFKNLMNDFLYIMSKANKDGGLYCGDVVARGVDK